MRGAAGLRPDAAAEDGAAARELPAGDGPKRSEAAPSGRRVRGAEGLRPDAAAEDGAAARRLPAGGGGAGRLPRRLPGSKAAGAEGHAGTARGGGAGRRPTGAAAGAADGDRADGDRGPAGARRATEGARDRRVRDLALSRVLAAAGGHAPAAGGSAALLHSHAAARGHEPDAAGPGEALGVPDAGDAGVVRAEGSRRVARGGAAAAAALRVAGRRLSATAAAADDCEVGGAPRAANAVESSACQVPTSLETGSRQQGIGLLRPGSVGAAASRARVLRLPELPPAGGLISAPIYGL